MGEAHKKEDMYEHLANIEKDLAGDKPLTKDQKEDIKDELEHIIQDICSDKNIHVKDLTDKKLRSMGLTQDEIDKIKSLRDIYNDVNSNKPIDKKALADKVHHVEEELGVGSEKSVSRKDIKPKKPQSKPKEKPVEKPKEKPK